MADKVGIDIGNSSVKFFSDKGFGEIPTWRARGRLTEVVADPNSQLSAIHYNGEDLILGEDAVLGNNFVWKTDEEKNDEINMPFILLALARMGITDADIVLGLPVSTASSRKKVEKVKETYSGVKEAVVNGRNMTFSIRTNVMAEPLGTYLSLVLDENFRTVKSSPYFHDQLAIVDIGYGTVNIVILERGRLATTRTSTLSGMIRLFGKVKADLEASSRQDAAERGGQNTQKLREPFRISRTQNQRRIRSARFLEAGSTVQGTDREGHYRRDQGHVERNQAGQDPADRRRVTAPAE